MKTYNQKGFTGLEIAAVLAIGYVAALVLGPVIKPLIPGIGNGAGQTSTQKSSYKETMEPVLTKDGSPMQVETKDGQEAYLFKRVKSNDASDQKIVPPAPWYERFLQWLFSLGFLGLALALAFPAAFWGVWHFIAKRWDALWAEKEAQRIQAETIRTEAKRIVVSIDKGTEAFNTEIEKAATPELKVALTAARDSFFKAMSVKQDQSTKDLVKVLKATSS